MRCPLSKVTILSNITPITAVRQFLQSDLVSGNNMTSLSKTHFVSLPRAISVLSKLAKGKEADPEAELGPARCPEFTRFRLSLTLPNPFLERHMPLPLVELRSY